MSSRFLSHSRWKNQILTASKRDAWHSELDLINSAIGNESCDTVQATHEWALFSCGNAIGIIPVNEPGKYGQAHPKVACGTVSDLSVSPFPGDRQGIVSSTDGQVRIFTLPNAGAEFDAQPVSTVRASGGTASTPVLIQHHPQVSGVFLIASGSKVDVVSVQEGIQQTIDCISPAITAAWSFDGAKVLVVSKDSTLRIFDARSGKSLAEAKLVGSKPVVRCLPDDLFVISNLSRSRERELNLYNLADPAKSLHTWSLGTASTPLIPVLDHGRNIVYLLDKSAGTLRWAETFAPWNEGAASTGVEQSSSGTLIQSMALRLMEGEINRFMIADTKGNLVPVKISIGRKSYLEFHDDLYDEIPIAASISAKDYFNGQDEFAKVAKLSPSLVEAAAKGQDIAHNATAPVRKQKAESAGNVPSKAAASAPSKSQYLDSDIAEKLERTIISEPETRKPVSVAQVAQKKPTAVDAGISAREQRAFERAEAKDREAAKAQDVKKSVAVKEVEEVAQEEAPSQSVHKEQDIAEPSPAVDSVPAEKEAETSIGRGRPPALDDEDALEQARSRRVTPAIESQAAQEKQAKQDESPLVVQSPQPQRNATSSGGAREVYREDPTQRRAEYGATVKKGSLFAQRMAQYDAVARGEIVREPSPESDASPRSAGSKEVFREDRTSRRSEYGAPSKLSESPRPTSASASSPLKRETSTPSKSVVPVKSTSPTKAIAAPSAPREVYKEDLTARRAEYGSGASPSLVKSPLKEEPSFKQPTRVTTAEREVYREDLSARRAEYGAATPKLEHVSTSNKEIQRALGNPEPKTPVESVESELEPYKAKDKIRPASPTREALEDAYVVIDQSDADGHEEEPSNQASPMEVSSEKPKTAERELETAKETPATKPVATEEKPSIECPPAQEDSAKADEAAPAKKESRNAGASKQISDSVLPPFKEYTRKYLTGFAHHPRESYTSFTSLNAGLPNTARMIDANKTTILCPLAGPGGRVGILQVSKPGRMPSFIPALMGGAVVADFEFDRFVSGRAVTAHVDQAIKVWQLPDDLEAIEADIETPVRVITGFDRILSLAYHPVAKDVLLAVTPTKVHIINVSTGDKISTFPLRGIANVTWSLDGEQIAVGKSDKTITVLDAHDGSEIVSLASAHSSTRPFRLAFVGQHHLATAGFGKGSTREVALYNLQTAEHLDTAELDISPSPFSLPYFDTVSRVLFLTPRGTSNILAFTIKDDTLTQLPTYSAADPVMGVAFLPVHECNVAAAEVAKAYRLTTNEISVVGWEIPRPEGAFFHDDIFPDEVRDAYVPGLSASDWQAGKDASFKMVSLNAKGLKSATSAGIGKQASIARQQAKKVVGKPTSSGSESSTKKKGELDQMFDKAKAVVGDVDEPEHSNAYGRWD
ncbi:hypothetical protein BCR37DRAFT_415281 [Protomyces lactucae-debilis]|uniref:Coronin-7 n=1 Tax=Protomyces lactucae-debilis TaxID=2754530 RepID=A0A1Y2F334_PROLT|nr:uncharacterized protein BCR37DRAFT_415281 [Protomyces lactucae-debilis]ORY77375.1 hypothetical protein BCR37DRAFT_415281 [Protomyces lactucae-debilis]